MNNEETKYDIKRNMKLIHYKRTDADLDRQIQSLELVKKINLDDSDFLFNEKQEIDKIINDNNDNDNFLGILIKDETPNKEFYKIIIDNDSEIEIIEETSNNNILYIKKKSNKISSFVFCQCRDRHNPRTLVKLPMLGPCKGIGEKRPPTPRHYIEP